MATVLIIDDDHLICEMLSQAVSLLDHEPVTAHSLAQGLQLSRDMDIDVIYLDVHLPDGSGLEAISVLKATSGAPEIIIITGQGDVQGAEQAIKSGAWDYFTKPASVEAMTTPLKRALEYRSRRPVDETANLARSLERAGIVGSSQKLASCIEHMAAAAASDAGVLIQGETGTGKELFARAIHQNSLRKHGPFVVVDCAAIPEQLMESELFGSHKGAYTGADATRTGLVKQADGGTLFLDEIGELPLSQQKSLLRVLQEHRYRPLGSTREETSDFRLVAATNRNLDDMSRQEYFRSDLLYRLKSFALHLPPLRERGEDLNLLAHHRLAHLCDRYGMQPKGISAEYLDALAVHTWPGNVRELFNVVESSLAEARDDDMLVPKHLPMALRVAAAQSRVSGEEPGYPAGTALDPDTTLPPWKEFRDTGIRALERRYLESLLIRAEGNITNAARIANISRQRIYKMLKEHNISKEWRSDS